MRTDWNENTIDLVGEAVSEPVFSHSNHGEDYYKLPLRVLRLSGFEDVVNLTVSRSLLEECPAVPGGQLKVSGEVRSYNNKSGEGSRLVITVYVKTMSPADGEHSNQLRLAGVLCKPPIYRRTPLGREICDLMLAVNRKYGRADYLPCIAWGSLAKRCGGLNVGDGLQVEGRLQSRIYHKVLGTYSEQRVAYEVSIMGMSPSLPEKTEEKGL
ncbi:MAG: single-stranded DNA-binding protein [Oscillospiraceae bacterium]|nr:single-stranded DNA-binding protein [Oscillospiraceae bacterium]